MKRLGFTLSTPGGRRSICAGCPHAWVAPIDGLTSYSCELHDDDGWMVRVIHRLSDQEGAPPGGFLVATIDLGWRRRLSDAKALCNDHHQANGDDELLKRRWRA